MASASHAAVARTLYRELLKLDDPESELVLRRARTDRRGRTHLRFDQFYGGLEVWPGEVVVHLDAQGELDLVQGSYIPTPRGLSLEPQVSASQALTAARVALPLELHPAAANTVPDESQLVVYYGDDHVPHLAWRIDLSVDLLNDWRVVIDAQTADTRLAYNRVAQQVATTGSGVDLLGQTRSLDLWYQGGLYYMRDTSKPMFGTSGGVIEIYDATGLPNPPRPPPPPPPPGTSPF